MQNQPAEQRRRPGRGKEGDVDRSIKIDAAMQRRESRTGERGEGPEERRGGRKMASSAGSKGDDRWKVHQLEKDKLELTTAHNQELCSLQSELTRLRSSVERGEAQREELHYQLTVSQRDATRAARLSKDKHTLTERVAELQQKVEELQKALDVTRASRAEDQNALRQEMDERDRLIQNFGSENQRLHKLLQDHEEALSKSERGMKELQKEREKNGEMNRRQTEELKYLKEREQRSRRDKEASDQKVKSLESSVEAERAAHLESKFNSEIIQLRVRDLEAALAMERSGQQEAYCSLEMLRTQFREVEKAYNKTQHALERLQKEYEQCKSELSVALETEKKTTSDITERLEEEKRAHTDTHTQLKQAADKAEALMKDMRETLRQHNTTDTDPPAKNPPDVLQLLQTTLNTWKLRLETSDTQVKDLLCSSEKLREENQNLLKLNSDQIRQIEQAAIKLEQEVTRLGQESCDWSNLQTKMEDERKEREREVKKKTERYEQEEKARLSLLYCVHQRLIAGSVLLNPPQCMMGDFTWTELCDVINQQVDQLTSELREANDKNAHLQSVCENKSVCVRELQRSQAGVMARVEESVRKREEQWSQQHTHTVTQLNKELQRCVSECESVRVESACFLSACALLLGALTHTHGRLHSLCAQKHLLHTRLTQREHLEEEVRSLATALAGGEEENNNNNNEDRRRALALRRWRRCVCVVRAVNRWRALTTHTPVLFRLDRGGGVCGERSTATRKDGDREGLCVRWLCSKSLSSIILSATAQLQGVLATTGSSPSGVMSEARSALSRLLDHYIHQSDASSGLSLGRKTPPQTDLKGLVSGIHQHFLVFSERLHSTEVERRKLRLEVCDLKKGLKREREETIKRVPQQRFNSVCVELRQALNREQEAQTIIQEQTNEHNGTKHTLRQTEQEVSHKEESLRILGKHLSGVQQERKQLEQKLKKAQDQLTDADRRKHFLISNMKAAETSYKEVRESVVQSRQSLSEKPRLPVDLIGAESNMGVPEVAAFQSLLSSFSQLLQSCCSRIGWLEQEVSAHSSHVIALRKELQEVCLRDNQGYVPEVNAHSRELQDVSLRDNKAYVPAAEFPKTPEPLPVRDVSKELSIILNSALFHTKPAPFVISPTPSLEQSIPQKKYRRGGDRQTHRK